MTDHNIESLKAAYGKGVQIIDSYAACPLFFVNRRKSGSILLFCHAQIGASFLLDLPQFKPLLDNEILMSDIRVLSLPGHVDHSIGFLHLPSETLMSGDCLQLKGIGKYRKNIADRDAYERSVQKLLAMKLKKIVAAHEFDPLGSVADGEKAVRYYLEKCFELW